MDIVANGASSCLIWKDGGGLLEKIRPPTNPHSTSMIHGKPSSTGLERFGVRETLDYTKPVLTTYAEARAETLHYKSAKMGLGKSYIPGQELPARVKDGSITLGDATKRSEPAKDVIFYELDDINKLALNNSQKRARSPSTSEGSTKAKESDEQAFHDFDAETAARYASKYTAERIAPQNVDMRKAQADSVKQKSHETAPSANSSLARIMGFDDDSITLVQKASTHENMLMYVKHVIKSRRLAGVAYTHPRQTF